MAALPDKLRFAFTPSGGYKEGVLYPLVPNDNVGNFDVVRPTSVDRINKDGEVESVPPNVPVLDYSDGGCPKLKVTTDTIDGAGDISVFEQVNGLLFVDYRQESEQNSLCTLRLEKDSSNYLDVGINSLNQAYCSITNGGIVVGSQTFDLHSTLQNRLAILYQDNASALYVNGLKIADLGGLISGDFTELKLNNLVGLTKSIQNWSDVESVDIETIVGYQSYSDMTSQFNFNTL